MAWSAPRPKRALPMVLTYGHPIPSAHGYPALIPATTGASGEWSKNISRRGQEGLAKIAELRPSTSGCFMFDTTNYFTFMASDAESELASATSKEGADWLRQIGLALLVDRHTRLRYRD